MIKTIGRKDLGLGSLTNLTDGGEGRRGYITSEETKEKQSISAKNRPLISNETKLKFRNYRIEANKINNPMKGKNHYIIWIEKYGKNIADIKQKELKLKISNSNKGKIRTDEERHKISEINKGKKLSEETKKKISNSNKGKIRTKETCQKISEGLKGIVRTEEQNLKNSERNKGKKLSEETKKKISESQKNSSLCKKVYQYDIESNLINEYKSVNECARINNLRANAICQCCNNKKEIYSGFIWSYYKK